MKEDGKIMEEPERSIGCVVFVLPILSGGRFL
jgi:hypothetical protein